MKKSILFSIILMLAAGVFFTACAPKTNPETKKAAEGVVTEMTKYIEDFKKMPVDANTPDQMITDKVKGFEPIAKKWDDAKFQKEIVKEELDVIVKNKTAAEAAWKQAQADMTKKIQDLKANPAPAAPEGDKKEEAKK